MSRLKTLLGDESAQGMTEYAIIVGTVVFTAIVTFAALGGRLVEIIKTVKGQIDTVPTS